MSRSMSGIQKSPWVSDFRSSGVIRRGRRLLGFGTDYLVSGGTGVRRWAATATPAPVEAARRRSPRYRVEGNDDPRTSGGGWKTDPGADRHRQAAARNG